MVNALLATPTGPYPDVYAANRCRATILSHGPIGSTVRMTVRAPLTEPSREPNGAAFLQFLFR